LPDGIFDGLGLQTLFRDETAINEGASITREIREGIAGSKLLLAFYSSTYPSIIMARPRGLPADVDLDNLASREYLFVASADQRRPTDTILY